MKYILPNVDYGRDLDAYVSKNFQYWEFVSSQLAIRHNIVNVPTEAEWQNIELLVKEVLQPLRDKLGKALVINSGFRCKKLNDLAGSNDRSYHRLGCAIDIDSTKVTLMEILELAYSLPKWSEIIAEYFPNGWVHVAYSSGDQRKRLKLKDSTHNFSLVTIDQLRKLY